MTKLVRLLGVACLLLVSACGDGGPGGTPAGESGGGEGESVVRIGHFPNVTHAHGLVAHGLTRAGRGWFEERLGPGTRVEWYTYNAGPSAMEALLAGSIDATYVGPNPALNAYLKSAGAEIRVLAGATRGGAALVVRGDGRIAGAADLRGRKVATPQLGNTQDVSCRAWLASQGLTVTRTGGDVTVIPTANPDQLALFRSGELDAVWTVEPWVSRLEMEGGGTLLVSEDDSLTTILVASAKFLGERPEVADRLVAAHHELTDWIVAHPAEAKAAVRAELVAETRHDVSPALLDRCWPRMRFDAAVSIEEFTKFVRAAQSVGYLKDAGDLSRLVPTGP